jgi:hypothetical protein
MAIATNPYPSLPYTLNNTGKETICNSALKKWAAILDTLFENNLRDLLIKYLIMYLKLVR